jgi:hypothetical protein
LGGIFYLTFDYGTYQAHTPYLRHEGVLATADESIGDIAPLCTALAEAGFTFLGNDPRNLPTFVLAKKAAPRSAEVAFRMSLNRPPFDADTVWSEVARYLAKRLLGHGSRTRTRYSHHNFFRLFLVKV